MKDKKIRRKSYRIVKVVLIVFTPFFAGYLISYLPIRARGSYKLTQSGELRYGFGLSMSDLRQWNPEGCWWQGSFRNIRGEISTRGNSLGYFYCPLIAIDRKFNFPDKVLFTEENFNKDNFEKLRK